MPPPGDGPLLQCLDRETPRLLYGRPAAVAHFVRNTIAVALDHVAEAKKENAVREDLLSLLKAFHDEDRDGYPVVQVTFRIDAKNAPETSVHVRFTDTSTPSKKPIAKPLSIDALVVQSHAGMATFQCFHPLPVFLEQCSWTLTYCRSFVTTKTMLTAVRSFASLDDEVCAVAEEILGLGSDPSDLKVDEALGLDGIPSGQLNASQMKAVNAALTYPLVSVWGPPGTGKTQTIVEIILGLQKRFPEDRILVAAPTHNAVDNLMRRYLSVRGKEGPVALRVPTEVNCPLSLGYWVTCLDCQLTCPQRCAKWPRI